jgi:hypothetical protein
VWVAQRRTSIGDSQTGNLAAEEPAQLVAEFALEPAPRAGVRVVLERRLKMRVVTERRLEVRVVPEGKLGVE